MPASSRKKRARRTRPVSSKGNGSKRIRSRSRTAAKSARPAALAHAHTNGKGARVAAEMDRSDPQFKAALKSFSDAARYFRKQNYEKAQELFEKVVGSPARELAERARVHLALCERKLGTHGPAPKTAGDFYDLGVAKLNARAMEQAIEYLSKADKSAPNHEHIKYALAAAHSIQGNTDVALEHLRIAISLRASNRYQARYDDDFQALASDPRFKRLLHSGEGQES
jgi:tetratricopeptide (TPR) repeat protein